MLAEGVQGGLEVFFADVALEGPARGSDSGADEAVRVVRSVRRFPLVGLAQCVRAVARPLR